MSAGPHTLYIYTLTNSAWTIQTVPIVAEGNMMPIDYGWLAPFSP